MCCLHIYLWSKFFHSFWGVQVLIHALPRQTNRWPFNNEQLQHILVLDADKINIKIKTKLSLILLFNTELKPLLTLCKLMLLHSELDPLGLFCTLTLLNQKLRPITILPSWSKHHFWSTEGLEWDGKEQKNIKGKYINHHLNVTGRLKPSCW